MNKKNAIKEIGADEIFRKLNFLIKKFNIQSLLPKALVFEEMIKKEAVLNVSVLGRFKSGKSSFLNAVSKKEVLPVSVLPITAAITSLSWGKKDAAFIKIKGESFKKIEISKLEDFIGETKNPKNEKGVEAVSVKLKNLEEYKNICFMDTPGTGSVFAHNTKTSVSWLPKAEIAFLTISSEQPFSDSDARLLKRLSKHTPRIIIILTKADLVSEKELAELRGFITGKAEEKAGFKPDVFPFSIMPGFENSREKIGNYLKNVSLNHGKEKKKIILHKLSFLEVSCRKYFELALAAAKADKEACANLRKSIAGEKKTLKNVKSEADIIVKRNILNLREDLIKKFSIYRESVSEEINKIFKRDFAFNDISVKKAALKFSRWLGEVLKKSLKNISETESGQIIDEYLENIKLNRQRSVKAFQDRISSDVNKSLGIKFSGIKFEAEIKKPDKPDIRLGRIFDAPVQILGFLLPSRFFKPLIRRRFLSMIEWEIEKNLNRAAIQWHAACIKPIKEINEVSFKFMSDEIKFIENLLGEKKIQTGELKKILGEIAEIESELKDKIFYNTSLAGGGVRRNR